MLHAVGVVELPAAERGDDAVRLDVPVDREPRSNDIMLLEKFIYFLQGIFFKKGGIDIFSNSPDSYRV